jgi:rare lipoprotein A
MAVFTLDLAAPGCDGSINGSSRVREELTEIMPIQRCLPGLIASAMALCLPAAVEAAETGVATWYGTHHEGRRTSSGSIFHQDGMTAASNRLPLGTRVRVTMQETGSSVVVTVNDHMGGRALIDLSRGAAKQIGLYARGRGVVSVEATDEAPIEVAEATEEETADIVSSEPRGPRHMRRGGRSAAAHRAYYRGPSVILARHSVQPRATRRRL